MPNTFFDYLINFDIMLQTNHKFWSTATLSRPVKPLSSAGVTLFNKNESVGYKEGHPMIRLSGPFSKHLNDCEYSTIAEL